MKYSTLYYRPETNDLQVWSERRNYLPLLEGVSNLDGVVLDIGAHTGSFSILAAQLGFKDIRAFEPEQENFDLLRLNVKESKFSIFCSRYMVLGEYLISSVNVGEATHKESLFVDAGFNRAAHSVYSSVTRREGQIVRCDLFYEVLKDSSPTVVKIDVEGAESAYVFSADYLTSVIRLGVELHPGHTNVLKKHEEIVSAGFELITPIDFDKYKGKCVLALYKRIGT
jgi:FkbM family methyltransferase